MTNHQEPIDTQPHPEAAQAQPQANGSINPSRRRLGFAAVALAAGYGGLWLSQRRSVPIAEPLPGFWAHQWQTPDGAALPMAPFKGRPLLINFWATWCAPCVEELPLIDRFYQVQKTNGWQVLGLAVDKAVQVRGFLKALPLHFPIGMAAAESTTWGQALGNVSGSLPFSVVIDSAGAVAVRKLGRLEESDLKSWQNIT